MTTLRIRPEDIPAMNGMRAVVTGGASGIGLTLVKILLSKGAHVTILDLKIPDEYNPAKNPNMPLRVTTIVADTTSWVELGEAFKKIEACDALFANAGVPEGHDFLDHQFDKKELLEPDYRVIDVNLRGTLNTIKMGHYIMRRQGTGGSIVVTSSAMAYSADHTLPLYTATSAALIGLVRSLRSTLILDAITINAVAPSFTLTSMVPKHIVSLFIKSEVPVSSTQTVALAMAWQCTAKQTERVEDYGADTPGPGPYERWNGRTILTMGHTYVELEEMISRTKSAWFGRRLADWARRQQRATDDRGPEDLQEAEPGDGKRRKKYVRAGSLSVLTL